jgi:hypothetical protein
MKPNEDEAIVIPADCISVLMPPVLITRPEAAKLLKVEKTKREWRHMRPILTVVHDYACTLLLIYPGYTDYKLPPSPWITLIGDDLFRAEGPGAFEGEALATSS